MWALELQFLTNHIGHFILVTGLLDQLKNQGRVVMLSSSAHQLAAQGPNSFDPRTSETPPLRAGSVPNNEGRGLKPLPLISHKGLKAFVVYHFLNPSGKNYSGWTS